MNSEVVVAAADEIRLADRVGFQLSDLAENEAIEWYGSSNQGSGVKREFKGLLSKQTRESVIGIAIGAMEVWGV